METVVITGATSGIGLELTKKFILRNARIIMAVRNESKAKQIIEKLNYEHIVVLKLDLNSKASTIEFVDKLKQYDVDIFVNNAGVYHLDKQINQDNKETTMATNYLNTFLLNELLIPYFLTLDHQVNLILTSSIVYKNGKLNYDDFYSLNNYRKIQVYANTKLAICRYFTYLLDKYKDSNIKFNLTHPGIVYTPIIQKGYKSKFFVFCAKVFMKTFFNSVSNAADVDLYCLNEKDKNGDFVGPRFLNIKGKPKIIKLKKIAYQDVDKLIAFSKKELEL